MVHFPANHFWLPEGIVYSSKSGWLMHTSADFIVTCERKPAEKQRNRPARKEQSGKAKRSEANGNRNRNPQLISKTVPKKDSREIRHPYLLFSPNYATIDSIPILIIIHWYPSPIFQLTPSSTSTGCTQGSALKWPNIDANTWPDGSKEPPHTRCHVFIILKHWDRINHDGWHLGGQGLSK